MYIVKMTNCDIKIEKEEVASVVDGISRGVVKILKQGVFNPSYFVAVIKDPNALTEKEVEEGTGHYTGKIIPVPLPDLFLGLREKLLELTEGKKI